MQLTRPKKPDFMSLFLCENACLFHPSKCDEIKQHFTPQSPLSKKHVPKSTCQSRNPLLFSFFGPFFFFGKCPIACQTHPRELPKKTYKIIPFIAIKHFPRRLFRNSFGRRKSQKMSCLVKEKRETFCISWKSSQNNTKRYCQHFLYILCLGKYFPLFKTMPQNAAKSNNQRISRQHISTTFLSSSYFLVPVFTFPRRLLAATEKRAEWKSSQKHFPPSPFPN